MGLFIRHYRKLYIESKDNKEKVLWTNIKKAIMDDHNDIIKEVFTRGDQFEADRQQLLDDFYAREKALKVEDDKIYQSVDNLRGDMNILKGGILSLQGRGFKHDCRALLEDGHIITLNEFEALDTEHNIYKSLGGNSHGDALFDLVKVKYAAQVGHPIESDDKDPQI